MGPFGMAGWTCSFVLLGGRIWDGIRMEGMGRRAQKLAVSDGSSWLAGEVKVLPSIPPTLGRLIKGPSYYFPFQVKPT